jgi:O-antigen ligase
MTLISIARWTVLGALFLIAFLPLYVASDMFFPFITSKGFLFRILIGIAVGAFVLLALLDKKYRPKFSWTLGVYGALVVWMFIADLLAVNPHKAFWSNYERMDGWVTMIHVFLFFIVASTVLSVDKLWKRWWQVMLAASALVSIHGVWQLLGLADIHQGGMRLDANFGNAIYLAVYLMFMVGIAIWQAIESKGWLRYSLIALAVLQSILIFYTATRGVILALFAGAGLTALLWMLTAGKKARVASAGVLIGLVVIAGSFYLARDTDFVKNDPVLVRISSVFEASELKVRATLWTMALEGFQERPITGWGHEGYNYIFNEYYKPSLYAQEPWFDRAHSTYLDWLVAGGLPAALLFIGLLIAAFLALFRSKASPAERFILIGILAAYAVQAIAAFDNLFSYILLAAVLAMAHDKSARPIPALEKAPVLGESTGATVALPVVLVATIATVWMINMPSIDASKDLIRAAGSQDASVAVTHLQAASGRGSFATQEVMEQMMTFISNIAAQPSIPNEVKQRAAVLAFEQAEKEIAKAPLDARIHMIYSQGLRAIGNTEGYLEQVNIALTLSPKKQATYYQRGVFLWQTGNKTAAAEDFATGYALDTASEQGAAYAATGKFITGDIEGGKAILLEKFGTTTVDLDPLRFAFYEAKMYPELVAAAKLRVEKTNGSPEARFLLAQTLVVIGRVEEARAEIQATIKDNPSAAAQGAALLQQLGG